MNSSQSDMKFLVDYFFNSLRKFITNTIVRPAAAVVGTFFLILFGIWVVLFLILLNMIWG